MSRLTTIFSQYATGLFALFLASLVFAKSEVPTTATTAVVGEVSLVLGKATVGGATGRSVPAVVGLPIHVSDVIETASNGHVHIRFVDDELVSVRPLSTLEISRYEYNPQNPQNSAIKLNLVEGVAHAISGQAAKQARQNFRMNTPIAAIGVRGTDFTVSANSRSVFVIVNEGVIVAAPYSSQCSADALGPCSSLNAIELSGLSRQILELNVGTSGVSSALLPATTAQTQALMAEASARTNATSKPAKPSSEAKDLYTDTVTSRAVNTTLANSESVKPVVVTPPPVVVSLEFTPAVAQTKDALTTNTQLVWGRWSDRNLDKERITVSYDVAIENNRKISVGSLDYGLFRVEPDGKALDTGLGVLAFNLNKAQAQFTTTSGQVDLMQVSGGQLAIDFNKLAFSTSLQLNHAATGGITFEDSGFLFSNGYFNTSHDTQSMSGAVSLDGKEAGYLFQKTLLNGSVEGLTLWTRKP